MSLGLGLNLEQSQKLVMTPELQQAIKILQFSSTELRDYVNQIIVENPLLEIEEKIEREEGEIEEAAAPSLEKKEEKIDWEKYVGGIRDCSRSTIRREIKEGMSLENSVACEKNLQDYLLAQLGYLQLDCTEKRVGQYLVGNINSAGYLVVTVEQTAHDMKVDKKQVEKILKLIQNFDPAGVGARSLQECLTIQLKKEKDINKDLLYMVENHLENIGAGKLKKIAIDMKLSVLQVQKNADMIKTFNPKPGASFGGEERISYIIPDVIIECIKGEYVIIANDGQIPQLNINKTYRDVLNKSYNADHDAKKFVENKLNQALWLIRSIERRRTTIFRVTETLIKYQKEFFDRGVRYLKPLTLKQVAEVIGVHESTVSRATSNKYIQTPQGMYEFKFFFTAGLNTEEGESASIESIKKMMREIINGEEIRKPYSDQKLTEILKEKGICIARRTVAKYREELKILSAGQRRRY